jgi:hypothetical protein
MDDESLNFESSGNAATPNSGSILAQPPLQAEDSNGATATEEVNQGTITDGEFAPAVQHPQAKLT